MASTIKDWYVVCEDHVSGPYTRQRAEQLAARVLTGKWACTLPHRAEQHVRKPEPAWLVAANDRLWAEG